MLYSVAAKLERRDRSLNLGYLGYILISVLFLLFLSTKGIIVHGNLISFKIRAHELAYGIQRISHPCF